jgi:hypothetical protein
MSTYSDDEILLFLNNNVSIESNRSFAEMNFSLRDNNSKMEEALSEAILEKYKKEYGDIPRAIDRNRFKFGNSDKFSKDILGFFNKDGLDFFCTGHFWYPPGGWMGWHSNSHNPRGRIYISWAEEGGKSFFRYQDRKTGEIITQWEKKGWQINRFTIPTDDIFWHCVGSYTNRVSFGLSKISFNGAKN